MTAIRPARPVQTIATQLQKGMRVIVGGRFGLIDAFTSTEICVRFLTNDLDVSRRGESRSHDAAVAWADMVDVAGSNMFMDVQARTTWAGFKPHVQRKLEARLAVVCLVLTGARSGSELFTGPGEPIPELTPDQPMRVTARTEFVAQFLDHSEHSWVRELIAALNATADGDATVYTSRSGRSIGRWVRQMGEDGDGVFGLLDDRGGDRSKVIDGAQRRTDTLRLITEVIEGRNFRTRSRTSNSWVMGKVVDLADELGIAILGRTELARIVSAMMGAAGHNPSEVKGASHHGKREDHQNSRSIYAGQVESLDATIGDNLVRLTPDGEPRRPFVHVCIDNSTGLIISIGATGLYKEVNVGVLMYDAFRPALLVPDPDEVIRTRMKGMPSEIRTSGDYFNPGAAFKPGAIPGRIRSDNAAQNHSRFILGLAEAMGVDVTPSRPGVSPDNALAETTIGDLTAFCENQPGYVGRNTKERAEDVAKNDDILHIDDYSARLQHWAYFVHNHAPTAAPMFAQSKISRLQQWDHMIDLAGPPPMLLDRNALFSFLPRKHVTRTPKGIRVGGHFYSSHQLHRLPNHLIDLDRKVWVVHDPRQLDRVWIEDRSENVVIEVPNVLRDVMEAPLTQAITVSALRRGAIRDLGEHHAIRSFAHHASQVLAFERTARIDRELADWRFSMAGYLTAIRNGAVVFDATGAVIDVPTAATGHPASAATSRPAAASGDGAAPSAAVSREAAGDQESDTEAFVDPLDRPLIHPQQGV